MSQDLYQNELTEKVSALRPVKTEEAGVFDNFAYGTGMAIGKGLAGIGSGIDILGGSLAVLQDKLLGTGTEAQDRYFKEHDDVFGSAMDYWTPRPNEVGIAAEVVGGLVSTLPILLVAPELVLAGQFGRTSEELVRKGVPAGQAQAVGAVESTALALGLWMPVLGQTGWQRVLVGGAGYNAVQGILTRGAAGEILKDTAARDDYKAFDPKALTLDVLFGLGFGTYAHLSPAQREAGAKAWAKVAEWAQQLSPGQMDAIAALRHAQHLNVDSAPGKLATPQDIEAHTSRVRMALDQLAKGDQVAVDAMPKPSFEPDAKRQRAAEQTIEILNKVAEKVRAEEGIMPLVGKEYPVNPILTAEQQVVERRAYETLEDFEAAKTRYAARGDTEGGKIISTDIARELSPDYSASKAARSSLAPAVHEPSSAFVKKLYAERLKQPSESGENLVTFTAGGAGVGKTTGIAETPLAAEISKVSDIVYDTNMNSFESARTKIDQALAAGKRVAIIYVGRDPMDAFVNGAIPRAERTGRTVVLNEFVRTHVGSTEAIPKLMEHYGADNPKVQFVFVDNSLGKGNAIVGTPELPKSFNHENLEARLREALDVEREAGRVSEAVYRGFLGNAVEGAAEAPGAGRGQESQRAGEKAGARQVTEAPAAKGGGAAEPPPPRGGDATEAAGAEVHPAMKEAELLVQEHPDLNLRLGTEADGTPILMKASDYIGSVKAGAAKLREDAKLVGVAAQCLLGIL